MESRIGFRVVAIIQLVLSLAYVVVVGVTTSAIVDSEFVELSTAVLTAYLFAVVLWSIIVSMMLLFRAKSSFLLVALNMAVNVFLAVWLALSELDKKDAVVVLFIISFVYGTYIIFMAVLLLFPANLAENLRTFREISLRFRYVTIGATAAVFSLIPAGIYLFQAIGYRYFVIENYTISYIDNGESLLYYGESRSSRSDIPCFDMDNSGGNPILQFKFNKAIEVSGIEIRPGSHSASELVAEDVELASGSESAAVGDLFHLNSSLTKMKISYDDGSATIVELPDSDTLHRLHINTRRTSLVKIEVLEYRKGSKWNRLCLSHLKFLRKVRPFQVRTRVYSTEGDVVKIMKKGAK